MRIISVACFAIFAWILFAGCSGNRPKPPPPGDPSLPEIDVLQLKENSEEALRMAQENRMELQGLNAKLKELESRMASVSDALSNLPLDRLDTLDGQVANIRHDIGALDDRISRIPRAPPPVPLMATFHPNSGTTSNGLPLKPANDSKEEDGDEPNPSAAPAGSNKPSNKPMTTASAHANATGKAKVGKDAKPQSHGGHSSPAIATGPSLPKKSSKPTPSEAAAYKQAFDLFYAGKYAAAQKSFLALIAASPQGSYADNSQYWIGECEYAQGHNESAIAAFNKVLEFAESEKFDDAQLKIGYAELRLGHKKEAKEAFSKLLSLYPDSEYLERAKEELAKLQ